MRRLSNFPSTTLPQTSRRTGRISDDFPFSKVLGGVEWNFDGWVERLKGISKEGGQVGWNFEGVLGRGGNFVVSGKGGGLFRKSLDLGEGVVLEFVFAGAEKGGTIG